MKTLIVDDQYDKVEILGKILKELGCETIKQVTSIKEALSALLEESYDLLLLDLQIPPDIGEPIDPKGGKELLDRILIDTNIIKPTHVIGITSHEESYSLCSDYFKAKGWSLVEGVEDEDYLRSLIQTKLEHSTFTINKFDIAFITALEHTELEAVLELPCDWEEYSVPNDCNIYYKGTITVDSGIKKSVIATSCPRMGITSAASTATKVSLLFQPDYLIMTGILAGIEGKVKLGDIIVADSCWDWGSGKITIKKNKVEFLSAPHQIQLDPALHSLAKKISTTRTNLDQLYCDWKDGRPSHDLNLHVGPVATGAVVLEDPGTVELILSQNRNTIGVEMEAYGVAAAVNVSSNTPPKVIIAKSVCDFADPQKNDDWQKYAAYTSASFVYHFIKEHLYP